MSPASLCAGYTQDQLKYSVTGLAEHQNYSALCLKVPLFFHLSFIETPCDIGSRIRFLALFHETFQMNMCL